MSCAIGDAVISIIEDENLRENATLVGSSLIADLNELKGKHSIIGDVRGVGMFIGIDLVKNRATREPATAEAQHIISRLKQEFILFSADGPHRNVLKFKPPMVLSIDDAKYLVKTLDSILDEMKAAN